MKTRHYQKGMTGTGWLIVLGLIGLATIVVIRLLPLYYENFQIRTVLENMQNDPEFSPTSKHIIWNSLAKRLNVNGVRSIRKEHLKLIKSKNKLTIVLDYETRLPFIANLDVVGKFTESIELPTK